MQLESLKRTSDWFRVEDFKSLDDPSGNVARKEMIVPLNEYPHDFRLGPNPREPKTNSKVSRRIAETLEEAPTTFHLLNRGITIVAKSVRYDNKSQRIKLQLHENEEEERYFGILDGGNTNERINIWRESLSGERADSVLPDTFVNVQLLLPKLNDFGEPSTAIEELLNDIKEARNTSVQVKDKDLADARRHFDRLKSVLADQSYAKNISWHDGDDGNIDVLDIITLLMIVYPRFAEEAEGNEPHGVYGHKDRCLGAYLRYAEEDGTKLERWIKIIPALVKLFDKLQVTFPDHYEGHFGRISDVRIYDEAKYEAGSKKRYAKTRFKSKFFESDMKYKYPIAFVYPLFAGFRVLAGDNSDGVVAWKVDDPIKFWKRNSQRLVRQFKPHMQTFDYDAKKIGTSPTCYQAVRQAVTDCYKDELLKGAGIEF